MRRIRRRFNPNSKKGEAIARIPELARDQQLSKQDQGMRRLRFLLRGETFGERRAPKTNLPNLILKLLRIGQWWEAELSVSSS
jgi:hypothetical protein